MADFDPSLEPTVEEAHRDFLAAMLKDAPLLARALDQVPEAWETLWAQRELSRLGDPKAYDALMKSRRLHRPSGTNHDAVRGKMARSHLRYLQERDFDFDFKGGTVTIKTGKRGTPRHLINRLVEALFEEVSLLPGYGALNTREARRKIAELLSPFFDSTTLDPRRSVSRQSHLIFDTIRDYLRQERREERRRARAKKLTPR